MEMIEEAYCSYEVAKLLKEKGFDENTSMVYTSYGDLCKCNRYNSIHNSNYNDITKNYFECTAPTHQMACAWIRKKGYSVEVHATAVGWHWEVCKINGTSIAFGGTIPSDNTNDGGAYDDYDECMENALIYTLINLI